MATATAFQHLPSGPCANACTHPSAIKRRSSATGLASSIRSQGCKVVHSFPYSLLPFGALLTLIALTGYLSPNISSSAGWKCHPLSQRKGNGNGQARRATDKSEPERMRVKREKRVRSSMATFQVFQVAGPSGHDRSTALHSAAPRSSSTISLSVCLGHAHLVSFTALVPLFQQNRQPSATVRTPPQWSQHLAMLPPNGTNDPTVVVVGQSSWSSSKRAPSVHCDDTLPLDCILFTSTDRTIWLILQQARLLPLSVRAIVFQLSYNLDKLVSSKFHFLSSLNH